MLSWPRYEPPAKSKGTIAVPFAGALWLEAADNAHTQSALSQFHYRLQAQGRVSPIDSTRDEALTYPLAMDY